MMSAIQFRTLGTLDLRAADGRELFSLLAQPKRVALLAYLCIAEPHGYHRRDKLLALFWRDSDQEHARTSLRKSLHVLRRALGEDTILSRGDDEVAINRDRIECDVTVFEECIREKRYQDAVEVYRGDLLTAFFVDEAPEFEQWLQAERSRLRTAAAHVAFGGAEELETNGDVGGALILAERALKIADTDERILRKVISLQCKSGNRASAIQTYDEYADRLAAEYQTEPSSETRSLIERIRAGAHDATSTATAIDRKPHVSSVTPTGRGSARRSSIFYAAGIVGILVFITAIWGWVRPPAPRRVVRYTLAIDSIEALATATPWSGRLALSPDGTRLAYIGGARSQLMMRMRNELHATAIASTEDASTPFFSPDGRSVGILQEQSILMVPIGGGPVVTIPSALTGVAGGSWGTDGFIYADGFLAKPLARIKAQRGAVGEWFTTLDTLNGEIDHAWPDALPNGKGVLFVVTYGGKNTRAGKASFAIAVADTRTGKHHIILGDAVYPRFVAPDKLLYQTPKGALMMVPFDEGSMRVTGAPTKLIDGMRVGRMGSADLATSTDGTLVYISGADKYDEELVWRARDGQPVGVDLDWHGFFVNPAISPDGKKLAIAKSGDGRTGDIWIKQLDHGPAMQLTHEGVFNSSPTWTPDGLSVTYVGNLPGSSNRMLTRRADGTGSSSSPFGDSLNVDSPRWSGDGKWLIFQTGSESDGGGDILGIRPGIDTAAVTLVASKAEDGWSELSPDGRWLAYNSNESGAFEIYVVPFPNTRAAKWMITTGGGRNPVWSHHSNELFYRGSNGDVFAVKIAVKPTFSFGQPKRLFAAPWEEFGNAGYAVTNDDRRFLMIRNLNRSVPEKLVVVENWIEELRGREPHK
jgi:DNA-binding SARP family transcriptional activator